MDMKQKIAFTVGCVEALACGVFAMWCYARSQYHQGRIDAANELRDEMLKLKAEMERKENFPKEEP